MISENKLSSAIISTPLGQMIAVSDECKLYRLEFADEHVLEKGSHTTKLAPPLQSIKSELNEYFAGTLESFKTPIMLQGSAFQINVWNALHQIPYAETRSYAQMAQGIGKPTAFRAVANANGANRFTIIVPCHRVIRTGGALGGYGGGIERKIWLLEHEKSSRLKK